MAAVLIKHESAFLHAAAVTIEEPVATGNKRARGLSVGFFEIISDIEPEPLASVDYEEAVDGALEALATPDPIEWRAEHGRGMSFDFFLALGQDADGDAPMLPADDDAAADAAAVTDCTRKRVSKRPRADSISRMLCIPGTDSEAEEHAAAGDDDDGDEAASAVTHDDTASLDELEMIEDLSSEAHAGGGVDGLCFHVPPLRHGSTYSSDGTGSGGDAMLPMDDGDSSDDDYSPLASSHSRHQQHQRALPPPPPPLRVVTRGAAAVPAAQQRHNAALASAVHLELPPPPADGVARVGAYTRAERAARLERFHAKRARRIWRKKIKYDCRKKLADSRPRLKGRFVTAKDLNGPNGAAIAAALAAAAANAAAAAAALPPQPTLTVAAPKRALGAAAAKAPPRRKPAASPRMSKAATAASETSAQETASPSSSDSEGGAGARFGDGGSSGGGGAESASVAAPARMGRGARLAARAARAVA
ncbi:hypothetical protein JKP88DRAFT_262642 [Tribonema minus]|uniref:CCT domain-containing protein n=1 Tax=Tribonema minus TaxID=303371 RepID=A0A836CJE3_9STRA|nr:hypothetical protein JKP88DRAFT_262642 [Tribonema minus]